MFNTYNSFIKWKLGVKNRKQRNLYTKYGKHYFDFDSFSYQPDKFLYIAYIENGKYKMITLRFLPKMEYLIW